MTGRASRAPPWESRTGWVRPWITRVRRVCHEAVENHLKKQLNDINSQRRPYRACSGTYV